MKNSQNKTPYGVLLTQANKNNSLYNSLFYDIETNSYNGLFYSNLGISISSYYNKSLNFFKVLVLTVYGEARSGDYFDRFYVSPQNKQGLPCCYNLSYSYDTDSVDCPICCRKKSFCRSCCIVYNAECDTACYEICTVVAVSIGILGKVFRPLGLILPSAGAINNKCLKNCFDGCQSSTDKCKQQCENLGPK